MNVGLVDQIAAVKREIRMREHVYPRRVADGKMTPNKALEELAAMRAVLQTLEDLHAKREPALF